MIKLYVKDLKVICYIVLVQKERVKIDELKIVETEKPRLAAMLKEQQTELSAISSKEENLLAAAIPFETVININTGEEEGTNIELEKSNH